jgi:serine/threonine protein kinase
MTGPAIKILFLAANPTTTTRLALDVEAREIAEKVRDSRHREAFRFEQRWAVTPSDLQHALLDVRPDIVHFAGHAASGEGLIFDSGRQGASPVGTEALASLFSIVNRNAHRVRIVVLNACDSQNQAQALCQYVDCVIGMSASIPDDAAIIFAAAFYRALGFGTSVSDAFDLARNALQLANLGAARIPVLAVRAGLAPGALTLTLTGAPVEAPAPIPIVPSSFPPGRLAYGLPFQPGDSLCDGRFQIQEWLGQGAFATVWRATDRQRGDDVALKVLHDRYALDTVMRDRFFRGAALLTRLPHPQIVGVREPHIDSNGHQFYVMEFVRGQTLLEYVQLHKPTWEAIVRLLLPIGEALSYAHARNCIHRDVKPDNILVNDRGEAFLIDFDLVRDLYNEGGTQPGQMGTFHFAAPELLDQPQLADHRADQYGLAMTLAAAIAGRPPGRDAKRDSADFIAALTCPPPIRTILRRSTAWDASARYASVSELCRELRAVLLAAERRRRRMERQRYHPWIFGGTAAAVGLTTLLTLTAGDTADTKEPVPSSPTTSAQPIPRGEDKPYVDRPTVKDAPAPSSSVVDLQQALAQDHSGTVVTLRLSADNHEYEARNKADLALKAGYSPFITHGEKGYYYVYVGNYDSETQAMHDKAAAATILGKPVAIRRLRSECPSVRWTKQGIHECD